MDLPEECQLWMDLIYTCRHPNRSLADKHDQYGYLDEVVRKQVWKRWKSFNQEAKQETDGCLYWNFCDCFSHIHPLHNHHLPFAPHWYDTYFRKLKKNSWFAQSYCMVLRNCHGCQCFCNDDQLHLHVPGPQIGQLTGIAVQKLSSSRYSYQCIDLPNSICL